MRRRRPKIEDDAIEIEKPARRRRAPAAANTNRKGGQSVAGGQRPTHSRIHLTESTFSRSDNNTSTTQHVFSQIFVGRIEAVVGRPAPTAAAEAERGGRWRHDLGRQAPPRTPRESERMALFAPRHTQRTRSEGHSADTDGQPTHRFRQTPGHY